MATKEITWTTTVQEVYRAIVNESDIPSETGTESMDSFLAGLESEETRVQATVEDRETL